MREATLKLNKSDLNHAFSHYFDTIHTLLVAIIPLDKPIEMTQQSLAKMQIMAKGSAVSVSIFVKLFYN